MDRSPADGGDGPEPAARAEGRRGETADPAAPARDRDGGASDRAGPGGRVADPRVVPEGLDGPGLLDAVEAALGRLEIPSTRPDGATVASHCPAGHRSGPGTFRAEVVDGSLVLACARCERPSDELRLALFDPERFAELKWAEVGSDTPRPPAGPRPGLTAEQRAAIAADLAAAAATLPAWQAVAARAPRVARPIPPPPPGYPAARPGPDRADEGREPGRVIREAWGSAVGEADAIDAAIRRFPIRDIGRWKGHHAVRDLLHAGSYRDARLKEFRRLSLDEAWRRDDLAGLPAGLQLAGRQALAYRHGYYRMLYRAATEPPPGLRDPEVGRRIARLLACPPVGSWNQVDVEDRACDLPHICPWCAARKALESYRRFLEGPCSPGAARGTCLLLLGIRVPGRRLPYLEGPSVRAAVRTAGLRVLLGPERGPGLGREEVDFVRGHWGGALRALADKLGATGGVLTHRIGPARGKPGVALEHRLFLLATVPRACVEDIEYLRQATGVGSRIWPTFGQPRSEADRKERPEEALVTVEASALRTNAAGLRALWFGTGKRPFREMDVAPVNGNLMKRCGLGRRLDYRWEIAYNGQSRCVRPEPERFLHNRGELTMAETDRLHDEEDILRTAREPQEATAEDFARMVRLLRSRPDGQVLGRAGFEVRDPAHKIAAVIVQAEVNARQEGATGAPA